MCVDSRDQHGKAVVTEAVIIRSQVAEGINMSTSAKIAAADTLYREVLAQRSLQCSTV